MKLYEWEIKYIDEKIESLRKRINRQEKTDFYKHQKMYRELEGLERIKRTLCLQESFIRRSLEQ